MYKYAITFCRYLSTNVEGLDRLQHLETLRKMAPKTRSDPVITKLSTPKFKSIFTEELKTLASMFTSNGYELRIAGGAVRDLLMNIKPQDVDFATTATPEQMKRMFTKKEVRLINMNGEKHGTITPRINDKENFEVTTLRIDVVTDGRRAEVLYTTDWLLDANRRDLTINSMFLGLDGSVYDYFYGYDDLLQNRVAFVGDPVKRIQEDYLRILRYFRFYGRIAKQPDNHEEPTLEAIRNNVSGLEKISGERIWIEMKKILDGNFAGELMLTMIECGVGPHIGLPQNCNVDELAAVWRRNKTNRLQPITLLSTLLRSQEEAMKLHGRLKFSSYERDLLQFLIEHREAKPSVKPLQPYQCLVFDTKYKTYNVYEWVTEVLKYNSSPHLKDFEAWKVPKFPINGSMLMKKGVSGGRFMGHVINDLRALWVESEFKMSEEELLKKVPDIVRLLQEQKQEKRKK